MGRRTHLVGAILCAVIAVALTGLAPLLFRDIGPEDWQGWRVVTVIAVAAGWLSTFAWVRRLWWLAAVCLLTTLVGPWGFLYFGPLVALALAVIAAVAALRHRRVRNDQAAPRIT